MNDINIAKDFSEVPGPRYKSQGSYSGEEFREQFLEPAFTKAKENKEKICINLDGTYGYFESFLEEAFGGLGRKHKSDNILKYLSFISEEDPKLINKIEYFIKNCCKNVK